MTMAPSICTTPAGICREGQPDQSAHPEHGRRQGQIAAHVAAPLFKPLLRDAGGFHGHAQTSFGGVAHGGLEYLRHRLQRHQDIGKLGAGSPQHGSRAHALAHPLAQVRLRRLPQVQLRIQLPAEAFDIEQGLLQQNQLRLHLHVEASRGLEQAQQHLGEGDFLQRLVENRLAHGAHRRLQLIHPGARGTHPDSTCSAATRA
jgi:hypothetical protein